MIFCRKSYLHGLDEVSMSLYKYFMRIFIINFSIIVKKDEIKMVYNLFNKIRKYYLISIKNSHSDTVNVNNYCEYFHIENCQLIAHIFHLSSISIYIIDGYTLDWNLFFQYCIFFGLFPTFSCFDCILLIYRFN